MPAEPSILLLTGATGFIGRHLAPALARQGWRIRGVARPGSVRDMADVAEWALVADVGPNTDWSRALRGVQAVVHLAALAHQTDPSNQPSDGEYLRVNAEGSRQLARAVRANGGVTRFVLVSSIGAVAEVCNTPIDETSLASPVTPYGRSKLAAEQAVREEFRNAAVEWCVLRPALVYGPGNPGNMARLLRLVRSGVPLPFGRLDNRRSFLFVGNLVEALVQVLAASGLSGRVFPIADNESVSTAELVRLLARAAGRRARLWPAPDWSLDFAAGAGDFAEGFGLRSGLNGYSLRKLRESLVVSNSAFRRATGWQPRVTLEEGLRITLGEKGEGGSVNPAGLTSVN